MPPGSRWQARTFDNNQMIMGTLLRIVFLLITVGGVFGLIRLISHKDRMTSGFRKKLTSFLVSVAAMFALMISSGLSGWGPCGPGSDVARFYFYGAVAAFFISIISGVILIVASILERQQGLSKPPPSDPNE